MTFNPNPKPTNVGSGIDASTKGSLLLASTQEDKTSALVLVGVEENKLNVSDMDSNELLLEILIELKKMNLQLSIITDEEIDDAEMEM